MATPDSEPFPRSPSPKTLAARRSRQPVGGAPRVEAANRVGGTRDIQRAKGLKGVWGNARLTGSVAAVLLVLLAVEGITVLRVGSLLTLHVFLGVVLIPPIALKIASATYRFGRYYTGSPAYRRKGPPPAVLRLLGPMVVLLTIVLFATGVALLFASSSLRSTLITLHQVSFVLWFVVMTVHVLGHIRETAKLAPRDYLRRTRNQVDGAGLRQWAIVASLVLGIFLAAVLLGHIHHFLAG